MRKKIFGLGLLAAGLILATTLIGCGNNDGGDGQRPMTAISVTGVNQGQVIAVAPGAAARSFAAVPYPANTTDSVVWVVAQEGDYLDYAADGATLAIGEFKAASSRNVRVLARSSRDNGVEFSFYINITDAVSADAAANPFTWTFDQPPPLENIITDVAGNAWAVHTGNDDTAALGTAGNRTRAEFLNNMTLHGDRGTGTTYGVIWSAGGGFQGNPPAGTTPAGISANRLRFQGFGDTAETAFLSISRVQAPFRLEVYFAGTGNPVQEDALVVLVDGVEMDAFMTSQYPANSRQWVLKAEFDYHGTDPVTVQLGMRGPANSLRIFQVGLRAAPPYVPLQSIHIQYDDADVTAGTYDVLYLENRQFTVRFNPADASNRRIDWSSSAAAAAPVVGGLVQGVAVNEGPIAITASSPVAGVADAAVAVRVVRPPVASVEITGDNVVVVADDNLVLTASVLPATAADRTVVWLIGDTAVTDENKTTVSPYVDVYSFDGNELVLKAVAENLAGIAVRAEAVGNRSIGDDHEVAVWGDSPPAEEVEILGHARFVGVGMYADFDAVVTPEQAADLSVAWSLELYEGGNANSVATLAVGDGNAVAVRGVAPGRVVLTATSNDCDTVYEYRVLEVLPTATQDLYRMLLNDGRGEAPDVDPRTGRMTLQGGGVISSSLLNGHLVWVDVPVGVATLGVELDLYIPDSGFSADGAASNNSKMGLFVAHGDPRAITAPSGVGPVAWYLVYEDGTNQRLRRAQRRTGSSYDGSNAMGHTEAAGLNAAIAGTTIMTMRMLAPTLGDPLELRAVRHTFLLDGVVSGNENDVHGANANFPVEADASVRVGIIVSHNNAAGTTTAVVDQLRIRFDGDAGMSVVDLREPITLHSAP